MKSTDWINFDNYNFLVKGQKTIYQVCILLNKNLPHLCYNNKLLIAGNCHQIIKKILQTAINMSLFEFPDCYINFKGFFSEEFGFYVSINIMHYYTILFFLFLLILVCFNKRSSIKNWWNKPKTDDHILKNYFFNITSVLLVVLFILAIHLNYNTGLTLFENSQILLETIKSLNFKSFIRMIADLISNHLYSLEDELVFKNQYIYFKYYLYVKKKYLLVVFLYYCLIKWKFMAIKKTMNFAINIFPFFKKTINYLEKKPNIIAGLTIVGVAYFTETTTLIEREVVFEDLKTKQKVTYTIREIKPKK